MNVDLVFSFCTLSISEKKNAVNVGHILRNNIYFLKADPHL